MSKVTSVIDQMKAENLLEGSDILNQITDLRSGLTLASDGKKLNFDDYFEWLQTKTATVPHIELLPHVPSRQESNYIIQLIEALEQVQERAAFTINRAIAFQTRLIEVSAAIASASAAFEAWYLLALEEYFHATEIKLPQAARKALATSEFNRLMGNAPIIVQTLQTAVKAEIVTLEAKKKMAREKFEMGREQVNASWASQLPGNLGVSGDPGSLRLVREVKEVEDDDDEAPPSFVSKRPRLTEPASGGIEYFATGTPLTINTIAEPPNNEYVVVGRALGASAVKDEERVEETIDVIVPTVVCEKVVFEPKDEPAVTSAKEADKIIVLEEVTTVSTADEASEEPAKKADIPDLSQDDLIETTLPPQAAKEALQTYNPELAEVMTQAQTDAAQNALVATSVCGTALVDHKTYMGVDVGAGSDRTVASVITTKDGVITKVEPIPVELIPLDPGIIQVAEAVEQAEQSARQQIAAGLNIPSAFFKTGDPQPATEISPAQALATFSDDDGEIDPEDIAASVEKEEDVFDAENAVIETINLRTPEPAPQVKPAIRLVETDAELDDLLLTKRKPVSTPPVPVASQADAPPPASPLPTRKKLSFVYDDEA